MPQVDGHGSASHQPVLAVIKGLGDLGPHFADLVAQKPPQFVDVAGHSTVRAWIIESKAWALSPVS